MSRFSAISAVRRVPSAVTSACRCCAACDCACTTSIGRHRADLDLGLVVPEQLFGERQRLPRHVDRLHGEHVIPVRVAHVRDRVDRDLLQLDVGDVLVDARDEQLLPRRVDLEIAQQRLGVLRRPRRDVLRVDRRGRCSTLPSAGCRALSAKLPPPHGTSCASPPLNTNVELLMVAPVCPPEIVLVDAFFEL